MMDEVLATAWIILAIWLMTLVGGLLVLLAVWVSYGVMRHQDPASDPASDEAAFVLPDRWPQDEETPELPHPRIGGDDGLSPDEAAALDERIMLLLHGSGPSGQLSDDDVWRWIDQTMPPRHGPTDG
jgi:hypothetical protein